MPSNWWQPENQQTFQCLPAFLQKFQQDAHHFNRHAFTVIKDLSLRGQSQVQDFFLKPRPRTWKFFKAKDKAKTFSRGQGQGHKKFFEGQGRATQLSQGQHQGKLRQLPLGLWDKICIAVTENITFILQQFEWSMVLPADSLCISWFFPVYYRFFLSFTPSPGHLCITPVCSEQVICYVLSVIQLLRMNGFFPLATDFFLCAIALISTVVWVINGLNGRLPVY